MKPWTQLPGLRLRDVQRAESISSTTLGARTFTPKRIRVRVTYAAQTCPIALDRIATLLAALLDQPVRARKPGL